MANLLLADDHPIFLDGLSQFLTANKHAVICTARNAQGAIALLKTHQPDVLILDVSMTDGSGLDVLSAIRSEGNQVPVIFMTVSIDPASTLEALQNGVNGIVLKDSDPAELLGAIAKVLAGETCIDTKVSEKALFYSVSSERSVSTKDDLLTEREREIASFVKTGLRNQDIALKCGLTEGTVKVHLHNIFQKLGVKSRAELIVRSVSAPAA